MLEVRFRVRTRQRTCAPCDSVQRYSFSFRAYDEALASGF